MNSFRLPGIKFSPVTYKPYYFTFKDQQLGGVQVFFTDPAHAPLTAVNFCALEMLKGTYALDLFAEAAKTNKNFAMFDKVNGTDATRRALQEGKTAVQVVAEWKKGEEQFKHRRKKYLLY